MLKGILDKTIVFHVRSESIFKTMTSFDLYNVHTFTTLASASLSLVFSMILRGLMRLQMDIGSKIEGAVAAVATTTIDIESVRMETGLNCVLKSHTIRLQVDSVKLGGGTFVHSDSWSKGIVIFNIDNNLELEAAARISSDKGGSVRLVAGALTASRTSILSGLGGRTAEVS